jgi:hypothetical protein
MAKKLPQSRNGTPWIRLLILSIQSKAKLAGFSIGPEENDFPAALWGV